MSEKEDNPGSIIGIEDDPDDGKSIETKRSWVVLASAFLVQAIFISSAFLPSSYYIVFHEEFETGLGVVSWVGALSASIFLFIGPLSSTLCNWFGSRIVLVAGAIITCFGMLISGYAARSVYVLFFTFGVLPGIGVGLAFTPSVIIIGYYFDKHLTLANGIAMSGISVGIFFYPPLAQWLMDEVGWRSSLIIMAGLPLQAVALAMLLKPADLDTMNKILRRERKKTGEVEQANQQDLRVHLEILKNVKFVLLLFVYLIVTFGISLVFYHAVAFAQTQGLEGQKASMMFSVIGIANLFGRIAFSFIGHHPKIPVPAAFFTAFVIAGIVTPLCSIIKDYVGFLVYAFVFGFFVAPHGVYMPDLAMHFLGFHHYSVGFGYIAMAAGIGTLAGPPAAGFIYDATGSYMVTFITGGISMLVSMVMFAPVGLPGSCAVCKKTTEDGEEKEVCKKMTTERS